MRATDIINEVTIFDERRLLKGPWNNPGEVIEWLTKAGFQELGSGAYASVFHNPSHKRVVKVSNESDRCWTEFAMWVLNKPDPGPHLPNIAWIHQYGDPWKGDKRFFITVMEKLRPLTIDDLKKLDPIELIYLSQKTDVLGYISGGKAMDKKLEKFYEKMQKSPQQLLDMYREKYTPLIDVLRILQGTKGSFCSMDLHDENLMIRPSTGEIVVTDPWN